jgi:hypothetical protein
MDCGGDCLSCMAEAGDPDCIEEMLLLIGSEMASAAWDVVNDQFSAPEESARRKQVLAHHLQEWRLLEGMRP